MRRPDFFRLVVVAGLLSCGSAGRSTFGEEGPAPGAYDDLVAIDVLPADASLVGGDTKTTQAFTAQGRRADGSVRDLTNEVTWTTQNASLFTMSGATAIPTGMQGGTSFVRAVAGPASGQARVLVKWTKRVVTPGAPPDAAQKFANVTNDPALAPTLAYPYDGALLPPNLPVMEVQWRPAAATTVFDVSFAGPTIDLHAFTPCNAIGATGGCGLTLDAATWSAITSTLRGEDPADVVVRGAGTTPGAIGASGKASMQLASEDIRGGFYYWSTRAAAGGAPGIFRYDFATNKAGAFFTQGQCAGCHAITRDGTKMLAPVCTDARGCGRPLEVAVVDVATKQVVTPAMPVGDSDSVAWSPDNRFFVTTPSCATFDANGACATMANGVMSLIDASNNARIGPVPAGAGAMYPSFANDGKKLVYARGSVYRGPLGIQRAGLYLLDFDASQTPPAWGAEKPLLVSSNVEHENNYHPSFSPDDKWVLFTRSTCAATDDPNAGDINANVCDSYNDYTARTFAVAIGGGTGVECARANGPGRNIVSWPQWSPFKSKYKGGEVYWYTVSSVRDYGFHAMHTHNAQGNPATGVQQLWLVGFDPQKAASGADPSFAPVWLPFQDVASSNHIGQWTTKIVGGIN